MKQLASIWIFLLMIVAASEAQSATQPDTGWTLQQCIDYAKQHNISINTQRLDQQAAAQDLVAAKGARTPSLTGAVGNTFTHANNDAHGNGSLISQLSSSGTYALNSSLILWNDHAVDNTIRQKDLLFQSAGLSVVQQENNITIRIAQAYLDILLARENLYYIQNLVATSDSLVRQGQLFYDAGSIAKAALLQLQAQLASDKFALVQTQNAVRQNTLVLKQLLQLPSAADFDVTVPDGLQVNSTLYPLREVQQAALTNFPDTRIGHLGVDIASLGVSNAKAAYKPVLKATGALGSGYTDVLSNPVAAHQNYFTQTGNNFYQAIGLSLSIPIFSQRINKANFEKSKIAYNQAQYDLQNTELVLTQAVEQAYLTAQNGLQSYTAANEQLQAATESYRIGNEAFRLGSIDTYALLQQRNQYLQAIQSYTQARYTAILEQKLYEFYLNNTITL
ncbi:MAG: TolC family protein [Chitinophagaceae bacterium]